MKKSFILHVDSLSVLDELTNEQAGVLFKAIKDYQNGLIPELDFGLRMAFLPFENQFKRDAESYDKTCLRNKENGSKGGRPKKPTQTQKTQVVISKPKKADNDSDNENDSENNNIEIRKLTFANSLKPYIDKYGREFIKDFYLYWSETTLNNKKMKYELEKTWSLERRLYKWENNAKKFGTVLPIEEQTKFKAPWE